MTAKEGAQWLCRALSHHPVVDPYHRELIADWLDTPDPDTLDPQTLIDALEHSGAPELARLVATHRLDLAH